MKYAVFILTWILSWTVVAGSFDQKSAQTLSRLSVGVEWVTDRSVVASAKTKKMILELKRKLARTRQPEISSTDLQKIVELSLGYLEDEQTQTSNSIYLKGEWPSTATFKGFSAWIGFNKLRQEFQDPNSYVTSSVINLLLDILQRTTDPEVQRRIQALIEPALDSLSAYEDGLGYHFYPLDSVHSLHRAKEIQFAKYLGELILIPSD